MKDSLRSEKPVFDNFFREQLHELFRWRRDVRRFRRDPVRPEVLQQLLEVATLAPSVGLSEPWRFVVVDDGQRREAVRRSFLEANAEALSGYHGDRARLYATLKSRGLPKRPFI